MKSSVVHHRVEGDRFIVAASPKLLNGELKRTSSLRSRSYQTWTLLIGAVMALCLAIMGAWTTPTTLRLYCTRPAVSEPVNCVFTMSHGRLTADSTSHTIEAYDRFRASLLGDR